VCETLKAAILTDAGEASGKDVCEESIDPGLVCKSAADLIDENRKIQPLNCGSNGN